jgi:hypothetical protein
MSIVIALCHYLGLRTPILTSSSLGCEGVKSGHLLQICKRCGADTYLSAAGSKEYIEQEGLFAAEGLSVKYQNYVPVSYASSAFGSDDFIPYLSAIDLLFNCGTDSLKHLAHGSFS